MTYDKDNLFAKIIRGEIPCEKVYEDENVLAFNDINPKAPVHILLLPKKPYINMDEFTKNASAEEIATLFRVAGQLARDQNIAEHGYRISINNGDDGGQEIPHLHLHIRGGEKLKGF